MLETFDFTIRIGSTPTFLYFVMVNDKDIFADQFKHTTPYVYGVGILWMIKLVIQVYDSAWFINPTDFETLLY